MSADSRYWFERMLYSPAELEHEDNLSEVENPEEPRIKEKRYFTPKFIVRKLLHRLELRMLISGKAKSLRSEKRRRASESGTEKKYILIPRPDSAFMMNIRLLSLLGFWCRRLMIMWCALLNDSKSQVPKIIKIGAISTSSPFQSHCLSLSRTARSSLKWARAIWSNKASQIWEKSSLSPPPTTSYDEIQFALTSEAQGPLLRISAHLGSKVCLIFSKGQSSLILAKTSDE